MTPLRRPRGRRLAAVGRLRLPSHRESSATLAGAYPFLTSPPMSSGVPVGVDAFTGSPFAFDPWTAYELGVLTNPNVVLAGVIGAGKSALAKSLAVRSIPAGRRVYVPGDPKGEWAPVAHAVGGQVITLGPGLPTRLNPLDIPKGANPEAGRSEQVLLLVALAEITLHRLLHASEHTALDAALTTAGHHPPATLTGVLAALLDPDPHVATELGLPTTELAQDGRELAHGLRRLVRGDMAAMFDAPSTTTLDPAAVMVVLDLSGLGSNQDGLTVAMTCASAWLHTALATSTGHRWVIYDEAWRLLGTEGVLRRLQAQWKLSRGYGIANLMVLHRLSDLDAAGATGSGLRSLAAGLLADCSTRIIYRQESDQLTGTATALGLTAPERAILPALGRGTGLWKMPNASYVARHVLHTAEAVVYDTDTAMREKRYSAMVLSDPDPSPGLAPGAGVDVNVARVGGGW